MEIHPGLYKHFKGNQYRVIGTGRHSESLDELVIYRALYHSADHGAHALWVRPKEMFFDEVKKPEYTGARFVLVSSEGPFICKDCGERV